MNNKDLFLKIYNQIKTKEKTYYVTVIKDDNTFDMTDIYNGKERLFFLENGLYFISSDVLDIYNQFFPHFVNYIEITESDFNLILEDICYKVLPSKKIIMVESTENYLVEDSKCLLDYTNKNIENKQKENINVQYIDNEETALNTKLNIKYNKPQKNELLILGIILSLILGLKVLIFYISYILSFNILCLTGFTAVIVLFITFIILNTLGDITIRGVLDSFSSN